MSKQKAAKRFSTATEVNIEEAMSFINDPTIKPKQRVAKRFSAATEVNIEEAMNFINNGFQCFETAFALLPAEGEDEFELDGDCSESNMEQALQLIKEGSAHFSFNFHDNDAAAYHDLGNSDDDEDEDEVKQEENAAAGVIQRFFAQCRPVLAAFREKAELLERQQEEVEAQRISDLATIQAQVELEKQRLEQELQASTTNSPNRLSLRHQEWKDWESQSITNTQLTAALAQERKLSKKLSRQIKQAKQDKKRLLKQFDLLQLQELRNTIKMAQQETMVYTMMSQKFEKMMASTLVNIKDVEQKTQACQQETCKITNVIARVGVLLKQQEGQGGQEDREGSEQSLSRWNSQRTMMV